MTHKLHIESVTKVEVVGDKTTIFVSKGSNVYIDFGSVPNTPEYPEESLDESLDEEVVEEVVEAPKPKAKAKRQPKKEEVVVEEEVEEDEVEDEQDVEEDIPFDTSDDEGFTELVEEDIQSVNDVFAASSDTANAVAEDRDPKPKKTASTNLFSQNSDKTETTTGEKKSAFNF